MRTSSPLGVVLFRLTNGYEGDSGPCYGLDRGPHLFSNFGEFSFMSRDLLYA